MSCALSIEHEPTVRPSRIPLVDPLSVLYCAKLPLKFHHRKQRALCYGEIARFPVIKPIRLPIVRQCASRRTGSKPTRLDFVFTSTRGIVFLGPRAWACNGKRPPFCLLRPLCHGTACGIASRGVHHATPRHTTPRHAAPRHAAPRHATPLFLVAQLQNSRIIVTRAFPRFSGATGQQQPTCVRCIHNGRLAQEMESSRRSLEKETRQNGDRSRSSGVDGHVGDRERENAENDRALRCADEP